MQKKLQVLCVSKRLLSNPRRGCNSPAVPTPRSASSLCRPRANAPPRVKFVELFVPQRWLLLSPLVRAAFLWLVYIALIVKGKEGCERTKILKGNSEKEGDSKKYWRKTPNACFFQLKILKRSSSSFWRKPLIWTWQQKVKHLGNYFELSVFAV